MNLFRKISGFIATPAKGRFNGRLKWPILALAMLWVNISNAQMDGNSMKLISYNVLHGFNSDTVLMNRFVTWVKHYSPDIVCFQELNGFDQKKLEDLAARYGHPYAVINTGVTHPIGLTSRYPIVMVQHVVENMWHSYLYGNIAGWHIFVTHLSPFDVVSRRNDLRRVLAHIALLPKNEGILLAGDFNALAASDSSAYGEQFLKGMQKSEGRREPKSGLPIVKGLTIYRHNLDNGKIDYTVTSMALHNGLIDAVKKMNPHGFESSAPSRKFAGDNAHLKRIDYVFLNTALAQKLRVARIVKDSVTDSLSDHYPVYIELEKLDADPGKRKQD